MGSRATTLPPRLRRNLGLLGRFGVVGLSGVVVNMVTLIALRKVGPHFDDAVVGLAMSDFNLRWYHVYSTAAFLVAGPSRAAGTRAGGTSTGRSWSSASAGSSWASRSSPC